MCKFVVGLLTKKCKLFLGRDKPQAQIWKWTNFGTWLTKWM